MDEGKAHWIFIFVFVEAQIGPRPILVTLHSISKDTEFSTATWDIVIGCVRTMAVSQKYIVGGCCIMCLYVITQDFFMYVDSHYKDKRV